MAFTFADLKNLIWYWVDDVNPDGTGAGSYFTTAQVGVFLNNAQKEVQKQLVTSGELYYQKTIETVTVANQADYVLPSDFLDLYRLEYVESGTGDLESRRMLLNISLNQQFRFGNAPGSPYGYTIRGNRLTLYPTPDTSNKTLRLYYAYVAADMVNPTDVPDVPPQYQEYIAVLAALDCFVKDDRNPQNLVDKRNMYLDMMKKVEQQRADDSPRMIIDADSTGWRSGGGWLG